MNYHGSAQKIIISKCKIIKYYVITHMIPFNSESECKQPIRYFIQNIKINVSLLCIIVCMWKLYLNIQLKNR